MAKRGRPSGPDRETLSFRPRKRLITVVRRVAAAELRSLNAQMEVLMMEALKARGIWKNEPDEGPEGEED